MRIAVTAYGRDLSSRMDTSFGRAQWFVVIDTETGALESHSNRQNVNAPQGAGIQAAQNVSNLGVDAVLTGNVGPNAFKALKAASIGIFIIDSKDESVDSAIVKWKSGQAMEAAEATIEGHWV